MKILRYVLIGGAVILLRCPPASEGTHETKYFTKYLFQYKNSRNAVLGIRVLERKTYKPISHALVSFPGSDIESGYTSEDGTFITTVPPATYVVKVQSPGYYSSSNIADLEENHSRMIEFHLTKNRPKKVDPPSNPGHNPVSVYFEPGQSYIQPSYYSILDRVARFLRENPSVRAEIRGYGDTMGKDTDSFLSLRRAETVRNYLIGLAVEPSRLMIQEYNQWGQGTYGRVDIVFN